MALGAVKVVRVAVLSASAALPPLIGLFPTRYFLQALLDKAVFSPFLSQLFAAPFIPAAFAVTVCARCLFGGNAEFGSTDAAAFLEHIYHHTCLMQVTTVVGTLSKKDQPTEMNNVTGQIRLACKRNTVDPMSNQVSLKNQ
jgi:hypothetical protein